MTNFHTFAIGDVHGRADLLAGLLTEITSKANSHFEGNF